MTSTDLTAEIREFLITRRARITPTQAGLPGLGSNRRVKGLRREEVAMLAGVSVDYYVRMERGGLAGVSESVLNSLAEALRLDEAERTHLYSLARESGPSTTRRRRPPASTVRPAVQHVLDAMTDAPAWVRNGRHDIVAMNSLAQALYSPVLADPRRPANTTRFLYLDPAARDFFVDYDRCSPAPSPSGSGPNGPTGRAWCSSCWPRPPAVWPSTSTHWSSPASSKVSVLPWSLPRHWR